MSNIINAGLKIFDIIRALWEAPESRAETVRIMQSRGVNVDAQTVSKCLKTMKRAGFELFTIGKPAQIISTPFKTELTSDEMEGLITLIYCLRVFKREKLEQKCLHLENKLLGLTSDAREHLENSGYFRNYHYDFKWYIWKKTITLLNFLYSKNNPVIEFRLRGQRIRKGIVVDVFFRGDGPYVRFFDIKTQKISNFKIEKMVRIKYAGTYEPESLDFSEKTVFKITGKLMQSYTPKEGECIDYKKDYILVTSIFEEKEQLFTRLLKYGRCCEVIYPKKTRKAFKKFLDKLIIHYKVNVRV